MHEQSEGTENPWLEDERGYDRFSKGARRTLTRKSQTVGRGLAKRVGEQVMPFLVIGLGAFLGANSRYLVGGWAADRFGAAFPAGTLLINVTGSIVIGLFPTSIAERFAVHPNVRLFFAVGFIGAYTTFSTYKFESLALLQSRAYLFAVANLLGSLLLGFVAVMLGVIAGRLV